MLIGLLNGCDFANAPGSPLCTFSNATARPNDYFTLYVNTDVDADDDLASNYTFDFRDPAYNNQGVVSSICGMVFLLSVDSWCSVWTALAPLCTGPFSRNFCLLQCQPCAWRILTCN